VSRLPLPVSNYTCTVSANSIDLVAKSAEPISVSVRQAATITGVSRSLLYDEITAGRLRSFRIRGRRLVLFDDPRDWLLGHRATREASSLLKKVAAVSKTGSEDARPLELPVARHGADAGVGR
jgi:excisionase family DNA binding protein